MNIMSLKQIESFHGNDCYYDCFIVCEIFYEQIPIKTSIL